MISYICRIGSGITAVGNEFVDVDTQVEGDDDQTRGSNQKGEDDPEDVSKPTLVGVWLSREQLCNTPATVED